MPANDSSDCYHSIVLSPHLDDGVLSCGGQLNALRRSGERTLVATFFTGDVPSGAQTEFTQTVFHYMGLSPKSGMAQRREEDQQACACLGAEWLHLPFGEAICRSVESPAANAGGAGTNSVRHPYDSVGTLFGEPDREDTEAILPLLQENLATLPRAENWLVPLGIGGHVDHRLLRTAAERTAQAAALTADGAPNLRFYEDFPYCLRLKNRVRVLGPATFSIARALGASPPNRLVPKSIALTQKDLDRKIEALERYTSQVKPLFESSHKLQRAVRGYSQSVGGERVWSK